MPHLSLNVNIDPIDQVVKSWIPFPTEGFCQHSTQEDEAYYQEQNTEEERPNEKPLLKGKAMLAFWNLAQWWTAYTDLLNLPGSSLTRDGRPWGWLTKDHRALPMPHVWG